jgi:transcriptional regulator with XRE-family HTH domain
MSRAKSSLLRARESAREAMRQRIVLAIRESGLLQADIVEALGVDKSRVSRWANEDPAKGEIPSEEFLPLLPNLLRVNGHWLLTGQGPRRRRFAADDND